MVGLRRRRRGLMARSGKKVPTLMTMSMMRMKTSKEVMTKLRRRSMVRKGSLATVRWRCCWRGN